MTEKSSAQQYFSSRRCCVSNPTGVAFVACWTIGLLLLFLNHDRLGEWPADTATGLLVVGTVEICQNAFIEPVIDY